MKTNRLGKVATTFAGLALAAGVVNAPKAEAALYKVNISGTCVNASSEPIYFQNQVSAGSPFTLTFTLDTNTPPFDAGGATYDQFSSNYSFTSGDYTNTGVATYMRTSVAGDTNGISLVQFYLRNDLAQDIDPLGFITAAGNNSLKAPTIGFSLDELVASGTLHASSFVEGEYGWAAVAVGTLGGGQKLYGNFETIGFTPIPEPTSLALGFGIASALLLLRNRQQVTGVSSLC